MWDKIRRVEFSFSPEDRQLLRRLIVLVDDLKAATASLDTAVVNLTARIAAQPPTTGGSVSDADVQTAITDITAQAAAVNALVPPAVIPVPTAT